MQAINTNKGEVLPQRPAFPSTSLRPSAGCQLLLLFTAHHDVCMSVVSSLLC